MPELAFYKHLQDDGGVRYGASVNYHPVLHGFHPGPTENGRGLTWYAEVRCVGAGLPRQPEAVRQWLLAAGDVLRAGMSAAAAAVEAGAANNDWPFLFDVVDPPPGTAVTIMVSPMRRLPESVVADHLRRFADEFPNAVATLPVFEEP